MPKLTRWFLRSSMAFLLLSLLFGLLTAAARTGPVLASLPPLTPAYFHSFLVGWVTQLIFGVAFWMFPKYTQEKPRGSEPLGWATFWLLNLGLGLRLVAEPAVARIPDAGLGWALALSAIMQWLAGLAFVANTLPRVKGR